MNNGPDMVGKIILKTYLISSFLSEKKYCIFSACVVCLCLCMVTISTVSAAEVMPLSVRRLSHKCNITDLIWFVCCSLGTAVGRRSTWRWDSVCVWPTDDRANGAVSLQLLQERRDAQRRGHDLLDQLRQNRVRWHHKYIAPHGQYKLLSTRFPYGQGTLSTPVYWYQL